MTNSLLLGIPRSAIREYTGSFSFLACWIWNKITVHQYSYSTYKLSSDSFEVQSLNVSLSSLTLLRWGLDCVLPEWAVRWGWWSDSRPRGRGEAPPRHRGLQRGRSGGRALGRPPWPQPEQEKKLNQVLCSVRWNQFSLSAAVKLRI